jgi:hypothetical protein
VWCLGWNNQIVWLGQVLPKLSCAVPYFANKSVASLVCDLYLRGVPVDFDRYAPAFLCTIAKGFSVTLYLGILGYFWRKEKSSTALVYELLVFALLTLLISPVAWRHHYLLALLPILYLLVQPDINWRTLLIVATFILVAGTPFPDYVIVAVRKPVLDIVLASLVPISSLAVLYRLCVDYESMKLQAVRIHNRTAPKQTNVLTANQAFG